MIVLEICSLSGKCETLRTRGASPIQEVLRAVEEVVDVPANCQQWLVDSQEIALHHISTVADTSLRNGDRVTVVHTGFVPLVDIPTAFNLTLTSVRSRFRSPCSSAFTMIYKIRGSAAEGTMHFEPWRKNDHDRISYDIHAGTVKTCHSHWMAGTTESTAELNGENPLMDLMRSWRAPAARVLNEHECFWQIPEDEPDPPEQHTESGRHPCRRDHGGKQERPNYSALPGWFRVQPEEELVEIQVDIPVFGKRIRRMLIDKAGKPLRAALHGCHHGHLHQDIEEFDVVLSSDPSW